MSPAADTRKTIHYYSRFLPSTDRGGGSRRMLQMLELLQGADLELISSARGDRLTPEAIEALGAARKLDPACNAFDAPWAPLHRGMVRRLRAISEFWACSVSPDLRGVFIEDPVYFEPLINVMDERGIPWIAVCHNIESLSPEQVEQDCAMPLFQREVGLLRRARHVITISLEETWLLRNLGVAALYVPYYPSSELRERMLQVRKRRVASEKYGILVIGTAQNPPTRRGMELLGRWWSQNRWDHQVGPMKIAGFFTDRFFGQGQFGEGVQVLGPLNDAEHDEVLATTRACLCFQANGSGALTRLTEMSLAGVPMIANTMAARSHHGNPGLVEFEHLDQLKVLIENLVQGREALFPPPLPPAVTGTDLLNVLLNGG